MRKKENMELNQHLEAIKPSEIGKYLLVDTCFLLDAMNTRQKERVSKCGQIIEYFKKKEFSLHTINPVYIEFIKGSDTTSAKYL